jgi:hypothetical protein
MEARNSTRELSKSEAFEDDHDEELLISQTTQEGVTTSSKRLPTMAATLFVVGFIAVAAIATRTSYGHALLYGATRSTTGLPTEVDWLARAHVGCGQVLVDAKGYRDLPIANYFNTSSQCCRDAEKYAAWRKRIGLQIFVLGDPSILSRERTEHLYDSLSLELRCITRVIPGNKYHDYALGHVAGWDRAINFDGITVILEDDAVQHKKDLTVDQLLQRIQEDRIHGTGLTWLSIHNNGATAYAITKDEGTELFAGYHWRESTDLYMKKLYSRSNSTRLANDYTFQVWDAKSMHVV